jgi:hypothetical protein
MVIRIGTWNLENLFKPPNPFAPKTEQEYQAKLDALASAIARMDPMCWRCKRSATRWPWASLLIVSQAPGTSRRTLTGRPHSPT